MYLIGFQEHLVSQYVLRELAKRTSEQQQPVIYPPPDKVVIRTELERMRQAYQRLLHRLSAADLAQKQPMLSAFSVGGLLIHCLMAVEVIPQELASIRAGQDFYCLPSWIFNPVRLLSARLATRHVTLAALAHRFDAAVAATLAVLDTVQDHEWQNGAYFYDEGYWTVERIFTQQPHHFAEHAATVGQILVVKQHQLRQTTINPPWWERMMLRRKM